jgi:hypothetical protein
VRFITKKILVLFLFLFLSTTAFSRTFDAQEIKHQKLVGTTGAEYGTIVKSGDFNGDNLSELLVLAPYDNYLNGELRGAMTLENLISNKKVTLSSKKLKTNISRDLEVADFNNDGFDDIAFATVSDGVGQINLIFGSENIEKEFYPSLKLNFTDSSQLFGSEITAVDLNQDQVLDLLIGDPDAKGSQGIGAGVVHILINDGDFEKHRHIMLSGQQGGEKFGSSIGVSDLTGSSRPEIVVGAPRYGSQEQGRVYFYQDFFPLKNSKNLKPTTSKVGVYEHEWLGANIFTYTKKYEKPTLVVGNFPIWSDQNRVRLYVFQPNQDLVVDQIMSNSDGNLISSLNFTENGLLVLGAPTADPFAGSYGKVYVMENSPQKHLDIYEHSNFQISGSKTNSWFGHQVLLFEDKLAVSAIFTDSFTGVSNGSVNIYSAVNELMASVDSFTPDYVTRGEFIDEVVTRLNIKKTKKNEIEECKKYLEFCLFNFTNTSSYKDLNLEDMRLYPDVEQSKSYYDSVVTSTLLGWVNGFTHQKQTPFLPDKKITNIEALKILLIASEMSDDNFLSDLNNTERFSNSKWWYDYYLETAKEHKIIDDNFDPDAILTWRKLESMIEKTGKTYNKKLAVNL